MTQRRTSPHPTQGSQAANSDFSFMFKTRAAGKWILLTQNLSPEKSIFSPEEVGSFLGIWARPGTISQGFQGIFPGALQTQTLVRILVLSCFIHVVLPPLLSVSSYKVRGRGWKQSLGCWVEGMKSHG